MPNADSESPAYDAHCTPLIQALLQARTVKQGHIRFCDCEASHTCAYAHVWHVGAKPEYMHAFTYEHTATPACGTERKILPAHAEFCTTAPAAKSIQSAGEISRRIRAAAQPCSFRRSFLAQHLVDGYRHGIGQVERAGVGKHWDTQGVGVVFVQQTFRQTSAFPAENQKHVVAVFRLRVAPLALGGKK